MPLRRARPDREASLEVIDLEARLAPYVQDIDLATGQVRDEDREQEQIEPAVAVR